MRRTDIVVALRQATTELAHNAVQLGYAETASAHDTAAGERIAQRVRDSMRQAIARARLALDQLERSL